MQALRLDQTELGHVTTKCVDQHRALADQQIPVTRVGLADIAASPVDWRVPAPGVAVEVELRLS